ncbi:sigma-70 family RNA polymerase sigma factor [Pelomonas sp. UHG3]|uniref:Sigma-70 family RNA polymerase sigma factor n=1 Tax=Roseateles hydrophilus TaxID=2975054 RepID=A0ACC6C574_9BURK|nr:sigma-70 family RNA polymerase sigma factor [Pelomonas sp. UHG3]MCY4743504.1 sigma-70 family RNA polymerase sigma factor [Pelomonas sp. UHG3]
MTHTPSPAAAPDALDTWMARTALGDRAAFEALYKASSGTLLAVIVRLVGDRGHAEEILQEVYVTVWRSAGSYSPALGRPMTWLMSIARNRAIDGLRRRSREPDTISRYSARSDGDGDGDDDLLAQLPDTAAGPLALLEQASEQHTLEHCLEGLVERQRASLAMAYYDGLSHAEVAGRMAQPLGTVKSWIRRGLQSLRDCLDRAARAALPSAGAR